MRNKPLGFRNTSHEAGWISTADVFIFGSIFLTLFAVSSLQKRDASLIELEMKTNALSRVSDELTQQQNETSRLTTALAKEKENFQATGRDEKQQDNQLQKQIRDLRAAQMKLNAELAASTKSVGDGQKQRTILGSELRKAKVEIRSITNSAIQAEKSFTEQLSNAKIQIDDLKDKLIRLDEQLDKEKKARKRDQETVAFLQEKIRESEKEREVADRTARATQRKLNNKLVGLRGELKKVVLMVDVSGSMTTQNNWQPTLATIGRWVENLDVEQASLITFGTKAEELFAMQKLTDLSRDRLLRRLSSIEPAAEATNFLAAFQKAYEIADLDTIIIFSDGLPSVDVNGIKLIAGGGLPQEEFDRRQKQNYDSVRAVQKRILEMANAHPKVAINAIGLGPQVANKEVGNLLNQLAFENNGIFIALQSETREP